MKYGFIGCGNMGGAIAKALSTVTKDIMVTDRTGRAKTLAADLGIAYGTAEEIAANCDRIFLGVKPHLMEGVLAPLAPILAVRCVEDVREAVNHIAAHSTGHSEAIITRDPAAEKIFTGSVDSAAVYVNASTRFTDGGEFGLGCEMGISTQKLHARGPMGLRELTTYKYIIHGTGHVR